MVVKLPITGTTHILPFERLSPPDFERLCLWLVEREGYEQVEHLGAAGNEQGRDIVAWRNSERYVFQCKRVRSFFPSKAIEEIDKVLALPDAERPVELIFLVTCDASAETRKQARDRCSDHMRCNFWALTELDEKVKKYSEIMTEFFQISVQPTLPSTTATDFDTLLEHYNENFIGRVAQLDKLIEFSGQEIPGYLLVKAPSGYGKSTLLSRLIHLYQTYQWDGPRADLLYFFIQKQTIYDKPRTFFRSLNSQLMELFHNKTKETFDLDALALEFQRLWNEVVDNASRDKPLVLLIDGLDEMSWQEIEVADLLPNKLGPYVHVIVSSRPGLEFQQRTPVYHPFSLAQKLHLLPFRELEIQQLLDRLGVSANFGSDLASRIWEVTKGEPLFTSCVCEDVIKYGRPVLARLENDPPNGVKDYFHREAEHLISLAKSEDTRQVIGLLVNILDGITSEEIGEILKLSQWRVEDAVTPIKRFLQSNTKIRFERRELSEAINKKFGRHEQQRLREQILAWCKECEKEGWSEETPKYVLDYYANHLEKAADTEHLFRLVENNSWTKVKLDPVWVGSLIKDLQNTSIISANTFKSTGHVANWAQSMGYQLRRGIIEEIMSRLSKDAILFLAKLGNVDQALHLARYIEWRGADLIRDIVKVVESKPEWQERAIQIYLELARIADKDKILYQCQNRMYIAQEILHKFPPSFSGKAQNLINEATRRQGRIPQLFQDQYQLEYVLPTIALNSGLDEAERQANRFPPLQRSQAIRHISIVLPDGHPEKIRLAEEALSTLAELEENAVVAQEKMKTFVTLLPLLNDEERQITLLKSLETAGDYLQSLGEPEHYNWTQYWTIKRVAKIDLDWAKRITLESEWTGAFNAWTKVVEELAKVDYEEALQLLNDRYTNYALYPTALVDVIRVIAVDHEDTDRANSLIEEYEEKLRNYLPEAYVALAEGYLVCNNTLKAQEIFKHVFAISGKGFEHLNSKLQLAILKQAAEFLDVEVAYEHLADSPRYPGYSSESSEAKGVLGKMAAYQDNISFIKEHHLGLDAEIQALYYISGYRDAKVAKEHFDKWNLRWSRHKNIQHLKAYIKGAEVKQDPTKLPSLLEHFENYAETHNNHLCNQMFEFPSVLGHLVSSNKIKSKEAETIIEDSYTLLMNWQCGDSREFSECLCRYRDDILANLIGVMSQLNPNRAEQMINSPQLKPRIDFLLKYFIMYTEDTETIKSLVSRIIKASRETIQDPLERAASFYNLATLLPDEMIDEISNLIKLAEPLLEESRKSLSVEGKVAKGQALLKFVTSVGQFEYVIKALDATRGLLQLEDKLKVLNYFVYQAHKWSIDEKRALLIHLWETAVKSNFLDVQAIMVCSIPIVNSLAPHDAQGFWDLYRYVKWAQELPDLITDSVR